MKIRHLLILSTVSALFSCKNEQKESTEQTEITTVAKEKTSTDAGDDKTSAGWAGTYTGTTPCLEPCKGVKTEMKINADSTYTLSVQDIGRDDKPRVFTGTFNWDKANNVITLDANGDHHKFEVQEGSLKELDKFGNPEQLGKQEDYILKKQ